MTYTGPVPTAPGSDTPASDPKWAHWLNYQIIVQSDLAHAGRVAATEAIVAQTAMMQRMVDASTVHTDLMRQALSSPQTGTDIDAILKFALDFARVALDKPST